MLTLQTLPESLPHAHKAHVPEPSTDEPYRGLHPPSSRKGLLIGFAVTVTAEFLVAWGGNFTHYAPKPVVKDEETLVAIAMPKYEQDPEVMENPGERAPQSDALQDMAPPMQTDVPQVVMPESFVQQIEPPPPEITDLSKNITKIPAYRSSIGKIAVLDISDLDQIPTPKFRARPIYPFEMIREGLSGQVLVDFIVDTEGGVRNPVAVRSTNPAFEESAVTAVSKWKFTPGRKNNHSVYTHMQIPIIFNLHKEQEGE